MHSVDSFEVCKKHAVLVCYLGLVFTAEANKLCLPTNKGLKIRVEHFHSYMS